MRSRSLIRMAFRLTLGLAGAWSGKNFSTGSLRLIFPSAIAIPTAVEVKLLLSEYSACGDSALYGAHHPSATTCPCRTSMKLFIESILSSASMHESTAAEETPCSSGVLRGSGAARLMEPAKITSRKIERILTPNLQKIRPHPVPRPRISLIYLACSHHTSFRQIKSLVVSSWPARQ